MRGIDEVDSKILKDLLKDANKSFAEIAEEINLTKEAVAKRYHQMEQAGIIAGATVFIDYKSFGYNAVADFLVKVEKEKISQVVDYIQKIPNIYGVFPIVETEYNLSVVATLKDLQELGNVKEIIKRNNAVLNLRDHIWTDIKNIPENLSIIQLDERANAGIEKETQRLIRNRENNIQTDELDWKIVEKLAENSREPFRKIAQAVGTSMDTVARRFKKLNENKIIRTLIQIDPRKIGYYAIAKFNIAFASQTDLVDEIRKLVSIPDLFLIIKTSGEYDMGIWIMIKDLKQLLATQKEIVSMPGVARVEQKVFETDSPWPSPKQYISTF